MKETVSDNTWRGKQERDYSRLLWIQHAQRIVYFSPMEGFERKEFSDQQELMEYARACVNSGYHIG